MDVSLEVCFAREHARAADVLRHQAMGNWSWSSSSSSRSDDGAPRSDDDGCMRSTQWERRCATDEAGELKCETLRRVFRHCPGRAPEEVEREVNPPDGTPGSDRRVPFAADGLGTPRGDAWQPHNLDQMREQMEAMLGAFGQGGSWWSGGTWPGAEPQLPGRAPRQPERREPPLRVDEI
jgi:hypothetical protein